MIRTSAKVLSVLCLAAAVSPAGAQEPQDSTPASVAPAAAPDTTVWIAVQPRPRASVVGITLTFPVGSAHDARSSSLAARSRVTFGQW